MSHSIITLIGPDLRAVFVYSAAFRLNKRLLINSLLWTIIILCMPMVNMIMAISGVNHHDL